MNIEGLVTRIRTEFLDDYVASNEGDYLWKTAHIIASLSLSERELCRRLHLLSDSSSTEICQLIIAAVNGVFPRSWAIDDRILRIERLKFPGVTKPLIQTTTDWLDTNDPGWDEYQGTPTHFVVDSDDFHLTFNREPTAGGTVQMTVKRLPLTTILEKDPQSGAPEVRQLDDELIHGAMKYLYIKPDLEGYDPALSAKWANQFEMDINRITQDRAAMNPQQYVCRSERF